MIGKQSLLQKIMSVCWIRCQVTNVYAFNPKCIKMGELYGEYNDLTGEWKDGLGSSLIRAAVADTSPDTKCDGLVDRAL